MGDYAWLTESPTEVTVILMSEDNMVFRVDELSPYEGDYNVQTKTAVVMFASNGDITIDGTSALAGAELARGLSDMLDYVLDRDPGGFPPEGTKVRLAGWKDDHEVIAP